MSESLEKPIDPINMFSSPEGFVTELLSQSGLGQIASAFLLPYLRPLIGAGIDRLAGKEGDIIRPSDFMMLQGSAAKLLQRRYRGREFKNMYGDIVANVVDADNNRVAEGFFRGLGYSDIKAKVAVGSNFGSALATLADFQSETKGGVDTLSSALYSRRGSMRVSPGGPAESYVSQVHSGRRLIQGLVDSYRSDEFGGMSFSDVSGLASKIMRTGAIDAAAESGGYSDSRLARVRDQLAGFSGSLDSLKGVIESGGSSDSKLERIQAQIAGFSSSLDKLKDATESGGYSASQLKRIEARIKGFRGSLADLRNAAESDGSSDDRLARVKSQIKEFSDSFNNLKGATEPDGNEDSRLERIKARIKGFNSSLDKLKDVIDGDMSKVLDSMDKLFGGTTVAMANAKLDKITTSMQHAALVLGASGKDIAERGALAYSNIAAVGGTQGMGVRIGTQSLYYTQTDSDDARVSREQLIRGVSEGLSSTVLRGENRHLAEAFVAWRRMRKSKNEKDVSFDTFVSGLGDNPMTNESLSAKTEEYIKQMYPGISDDKVNLVRASINRSDEVVDVEETENLSAVISDRRVKEATTNRRKILADFYNKNKSGLSKSYKDADAFISEVTGGDITATHQTMRDRLYSMTAGTEGGASAVGAFETAIENMAGSDISKTGVNDARVAQQFIRKSEEAKRLRSQEVVYNKLSADAQNVLRTVQKSNGQTTVGKVLSEMYKGDTSLADLLAASFGVSVKELNKISENKEVDKALKLVQQVSSGKGSALAGIRKIGGKPESVEEAKQKDAEYAVLRTKAEAFIRKKAEGAEISADENRAYNSWIANTSFTSEADEIYYKNISKEQAASIVTGGEKQRANELKDNERRYTLAKSMMKDAGIEKHREFVSKLTSAEESLRKARKLSSSRTQQILGMSDDQRKALTGSKDTEILRLINESKSTISNIDGLDSTQRSELFKAVSETGMGTTQSALKLIIDLLTKISNKP